MQQGKRILYNIFREVEERYQKIEKLSDFNSSKSKKTIEDYLNAAAKTSEFLLHFIATFEASIITKFNQNNDTFDDSKFIKYFINRKHQILNNRRFMVNLENFYLTLVQDSGKEKEILERFREKMNKGGKLTRIRGLRNIQAHGPLNICMNDIRESFGIHSAENRSQEELLRITYNTLIGVKKDITDLCEEKQLDILEWASFTGYVPGNNELRTNKNRTMILDPEDEMLYIYKDLYIEQKNNKKEIKLRYDSVLDPLIIEDTQGFKALKDAYMYIEEDNQKQNTKGLYLKGEERIYKTDIYLNNLQKKHLLQLTIYTAGEQRKTESYPLKQEEFQEIALDLKILTDELNEGEHDLHLYIVEQNKPEEKITSENKKFQIEERKEGTIEVGIPFALGSESEETHSKAVQNKLYEITLPLENMGNIPRKVKITMAIKDKDHFTLHRTYEEYPEEKTQEKEVRLKGYEKKEITIELLPTRSEHEKYNIGKIIVEDLENGKREERELGSVEIIKIYEPVNFYNRTVLLTEMEEYYKEDQKVEKPDINRIWIRGEAGQGKSRLSQEIAERAKKENCTCISITKTEESAIYEETRMALNKQIQQYHKNSTLEFHKKESPRDEFGKPKPINWAQEIFTMLDQYEADIHTQNTIIYQIDDIHLLNEEFLKKINEEIEMRNRFNKETRKQIRMSVVLYSRTAAGLGHNVDETKEKEMQAILRDWEVKVLKKINPEDIEKIDIANEEDMIKDIMLEIFGPNGFKLEETNCLKKIISKKSEANPLIVQLLLEELERNAKLIKWDQENGHWEINWEKINIDESLSYEIEEEFQSLRLRAFEQRINELYPTEKLEERLLLEKLDQFKGTDAEMIMHLVGMLEGVSKDEFQKQELIVENNLEIMKILKENRISNKFQKKDYVYYTFKHHLYQDYWERYFGEEVKSLFTIWKKMTSKLTQEFNQKEFEEWIKETENFVHLSNHLETRVDKKIYSKKKEEYSKREFVNNEKYIDILEDDFYKIFTKKEDFYHCLEFRRIFLNALKRKYEMLSSLFIRYSNYILQFEHSFFDEIHDYYEHYTDRFDSESNDLKFKPFFRKEIKYLIDKILPEIDQYKETPLINASVYKTYSELLIAEGNYAEGKIMINKAVSLINKKHLEKTEGLHLHQKKADTLQILGDICIATGQMNEASNVFTECIQNYDKQIESGAYSYPCLVNKGIALSWKSHLSIDVGDYNKAFDLLNQVIESFEAAIQINANDNLLYSNLGAALYSKSIILINKGKYNASLVCLSEAENYYKVAININPSHSISYLNYALCLTSKGLIKYDKGEYDSALTDYKIAKKLFDLAIEINPFDSVYYVKNAYLLSNIGKTYSSSGNFTQAYKAYNEALSTLSKALKINPYNPSIYSTNGMILILKAENYLRQEDRRKSLDTYIEALNSYNTAIKLNSSGSELYNQMGNILQKTAEIYTYSNSTIDIIDIYDQALCYYESAIKYNPNNSDYYANTGNALQKLSRIMLGKNRSQETLAFAEKALEFYRKSVDLNPAMVISYSGIASALFLKAEAFILLKQYQEAILSFEKGEFAYEKVFSLNPNYANAYYNQATLFQKKGELLRRLEQKSSAVISFDRAIISLNKAIKINNSISLYFLAKGVTIFEKEMLLLQLDNDLKLNDLQASQNSFLTAIEMNSVEVYSSFCMKTLFDTVIKYIDDSIDHDKFENLILFYEESIKKYPKNYYSYICLGLLIIKFADINEKTGKLKKAKILSKKALRTFRLASKGFQNNILLSEFIEIAENLLEEK